MEEIATALDVMINGVVECLCRGLSLDLATHDESRAMHEELHGQALVQELVGPSVSKLLHATSKEAGRRTTVRYHEILRHPRFGREPLINERDNAHRSLQKALLPVIDKPTASELVSFEAARLRVFAVTQALGEECLSSPKAPRAKGGGRQRRRLITAADVPAAVRSLIMQAVESDAGWFNALEGLRKLERGELNKSGIVTTILALADMNDGLELMQRIANRIDRAGGGDESAAHRQVNERKETPATRSAQQSPLQTAPDIPKSDSLRNSVTPYVTPPLPKKAIVGHERAQTSKLQMSYEERVAARRAQRREEGDLTS